MRLRDFYRLFQGAHYLAVDEPILIDGEGQLEEDIYQIVILFGDLADEQLAKILFKFSPSAVLRLFVELALEDG